MESAGAVGGAEDGVAEGGGGGWGGRLVGGWGGGRVSVEGKHRFARRNGGINGRVQGKRRGRWEELKTGLRKAAAGGGEIHAIGVDTWGVDFGLLDRNGDLL